MALINMTNKNGVTLKTAGKYCSEDITIVPTFSVGTGDGVSFNIHYGTEAPQDTSKLWIEGVEPQKVIVTNEVIESDDTVETIETIETTLSAASSPVVVTVGTNMYLFGGSTIRIFDTITETITEITGTVLSSVQCAAAVGGKIYLFCGGYTATTHDICVFDINELTVSVLGTQAPTSVCRSAAVSVGMKIYLFGGFPANYSYTSAIYEFDTESETVTKLTAVLPKSVCSVSASVVGTKVYLFGGFYGSSASSIYQVNTICVFDTDALEITTLSVRLPQAAAAIASAAIGTKIYLYLEALQAPKSQIEAFWIQS